MARNEEKHFCNLNRLILLKEKEEYEKAHPSRPRLDSLDTPEEIQKWLPSIKRDIDFYLKKSQVICYSDAHVEECKEKVVKLEREFKAFVHKIKKLSPSPLDVIPWTSRPYKRKKSSCSEEQPSKEFKRIETPLLDDERNKPTIKSSDKTSLCLPVNWTLMDQPLNFSPVVSNSEKFDKQTRKNFKGSENNDFENCDMKYSKETKISQAENILLVESIHEQKLHKTKQSNRIIDYDSSDSES